MDITMTLDALMLHALLVVFISCNHVQSTNCKTFRLQMIVQLPAADWAASPPNGLGRIVYARILLLTLPMRSLLPPVHLCQISERAAGWACAAQTSLTAIGNQQRFAGVCKSMQVHLSLRHRLQQEKARPVAHLLLY